MTLGIILVDHGSRSRESNALLEELAQQFHQRDPGQFPIVEPAHMELAEPTIAAAYARCVERGATRIVVSPYFLGPGRHWTDDIPRLTREAASPFPQTEWSLAPPLGSDALMFALLEQRIREVL